MATRSLSARTRPLTWLLLEAASIVASILLAFAINAWWTQHTEAAEKNELLLSIKAELLENRKALESDLVYRRGVIASVISLLEASSVGHYNDPEKTLDHCLADLLWTGGDQAGSTGAVESILLGGRVASVEDETLRLALVRWPKGVAALSRIQNQDYVTFTEVMVPFLGRNAALPQLANEQYAHGRPGDRWGANPDLRIPIRDFVDHTALLHNREFAGILVRRLWNETDVLSSIEAFAEARNQLIRLIDQELKNTS